MTPTATCAICGRKYVGWELQNGEHKCCGKVLEVKS